MRQWGCLIGTTGYETLRPVAWNPQVLLVSHGNPIGVLLFEMRFHQFHKFGLMRKTCVVTRGTDKIEIYPILNDLGVILGACRLIFTSRIQFFLLLCRFFRTPI